MHTVVFLGTDKGAFLLRSTRAARDRWTLSGPVFPGWKVTAAARAADGRFVAATASHVYGALLHTSDDLENWSAVEKGPRYEPGRTLEQFWTLAPVTGGLYAGVAEAGLFHAEVPEGPWAGVDGLNDHPSRVMWQPGLGGLCAHVVLEHPTNPMRRWCGISAVGVFRSDDGGETWVPKNEGVPIVLGDPKFPGVGCCVHGLAVDSSGTLYRQDHMGMFRSRDAGDTWQRNESGLPTRFGFPVRVNPRTGHAYAIPIQSDEFRLPNDGAMAVYRSTNGGDSWSALRTGLPQENMWATVLRGALDVDEFGGVFVGTTGGTIHLSADEGETWQGGFGILPRILCVKAFVL